MQREKQHRNKKKLQHQEFNMKLSQEEQKERTFFITDTLKTPSVKMWKMSLPYQECRDKTSPVCVKMLWLHPQRREMKSMRGFCSGSKHAYSVWLIKILKLYLGHKTPPHFLNKPTGDFSHMSHSHLVTCVSGEVGFVLAFLYFYFHMHALFKSNSPKITLNRKMKCFHFCLFSYLHCHFVCPEASLKVKNFPLHSAWHMHRNPALLSPL